MRSSNGFQGLLLGSALGLGLGACVITTDSDSGDRFAAEDGLDCEIALQTSGAVQTQVDDTTGCTHGAGLMVVGDAMPKVERDLGLILPDLAPIELVQIQWDVTLDHSGTAVPATVILHEGAERWATPEGACETDYTSRACTTSAGEPGRKLELTRVSCSADAVREGGSDTIRIESLRATSNCVEESFLREDNDAGL